MVDVFADGLSALGRRTLASALCGAALGLLWSVPAVRSATKTTARQIYYTATGTGGTERTQHAKNGDTVSVKDYGAVGDGSTDDSAAIQAAINAGGGKAVYFPAPSVSYKVPSTLTITVANTRIIGDGSASKIFMAFTTTGPTGGVLFDVSASGVEFNGIAIDSTGSANTPTATINHYGIRFHGTSGTHLTDEVVRNCSFTNLPWADNFVNVVSTHATYFSWVDRVIVRDNMFESPSGAAVFMSGVTGFKVLDNNINNTGWYSIQANDVVTQGRIAGNRITGTVSGGRVWGGSINLMSNDSTGTACGTQGCARISDVEVDHNYISGVHSYTGAVHIESCSYISFHDNMLENITLSLGSPFYPDGTPVVYIRPYVRPTNVPATGNEGPNDHIDISHNLLIAGSVGAIAIYADAQDNGSGGTPLFQTLPYSDTLTVEGNQIRSLDTTHYFSNGISVHGQQGGWKNVLISGNMVSGFPDGTSPNAGMIGIVGLTGVPVLDTTIVGNNLTVVGGTPSTTTQLGIGAGAFTTRTLITGNQVGAFWTGIRTFANALSTFIGPNTFAGSGSTDYLISPSPSIPFGVASRYGSLILTGRGSALAATSVVATAPVGEYRVSVTARTTTSGTGTTGTASIVWTDEGGVKTFTTGTFALNAVDVTGQVNATAFIHAAASTNIQVSVAGTFGTSVYAVSAVVEKLN